jgi:hypothetical protein
MKKMQNKIDMLVDDVKKMSEDLIKISKVKEVSKEIGGDFEEGDFKYPS